MIRGMARLMGAATAGTAAMAPSSSTAFCHASSQEHLNISSALNMSQKETSYGSTPSKVAADARLLNADDLEYSSDEDWGKLSYNRLIFSPAPSEEEVEVATKELHAALHLSIPASTSTADVSEPMPMIENRGESVPTVDADKVVDKPLPSLAAGLGLLAAGSNSVYQAFHLLQTNSKVQDAVKSLARDPAVWRAVLSNEKVQELTQTLHEGQSENFCNKSGFVEEDGGELNILTLTSKVCDFVTAKVLQILDKVVEIVGSIFSSVEKTFFSKENGTNLDRTVASCMMLAVAVLLVVVVKRVGR